MTRRPGHAQVLNALDVALSTPKSLGVKLNVVVVKDLNEGEIFDFLELTKDRNLSVRFIEFMPFTGHMFSRLSYLIRL